MMVVTQSPQKLDLPKKKKKKKVAPYLSWIFSELWMA